MSQHGNLQQSLPPPLACKLQWSLASKIFSCAWGKLAFFSSPVPQLLTAGTKSWAHLIPDIDSLAQNSCYKYRSFNIFFALSLLGSWGFLNCSRSGWYLLHITPGRPECTMPQSCPGFDHFWLVVRDGLLQEELQKMLLPVSESVKYGHRRGGLAFQPVCADINQGAGPLLPGPHDCPLTLLFDLLDSCHPAQTPNIHLTSEVSSFKQLVVLPQALGKMTS